MHLPKLSLLPLVMLAMAIPIFATFLPEMVSLDEPKARLTDPSLSTLIKRGIGEDMRFLTAEQERVQKLYSDVGTTTDAVQMECLGVLIAVEEFVVENGIYGANIYELALKINQLLLATWFGPFQRSTYMGRNSQIWEQLVDAGMFIGYPPGHEFSVVFKSNLFRLVPWKTATELGMIAPLGQAQKKAIKIIQQLALNQVKANLDGWETWLSSAQGDPVRRVLEPCINFFSEQK